MMKAKPTKAPGGGSDTDTVSSSLHSRTGRSCYKPQPAGSVWGSRGW